MEKKSRYYHSKDFSNLVDDILKNNKSRSNVFTLEDILYYRWYYWQKRIIEEYFLYTVIIDEMFKFIGHPEINYDYVCKHQYINYLEWYYNWHWTEEQYHEFEKKVLRPIFKKMRPCAMNNYIDNLCASFNLIYGLTYMNEDEIENRRMQEKEKVDAVCKKFNKTVDEYFKCKVNRKGNDFSSPEMVFLHEKYSDKISNRKWKEIREKCKYSYDEVEKYLLENYG